MPHFKRARDITVGVIGYGGAFNMGRKHLQEMQAAGMTPVAVAEIDASRLAVAEADFPGIETYTDVATMLKRSDVNLITIITPHNTHAPLAIKCLRAGKHVVCEKPLAITTRECDAMIAAAKKHRVVISTYHNRHWDGCILEAVDRIKRKKQIGEIVRIECHMGGYSQPSDWWRSSRSISGGIMYDWGVHLLEYALQLLPGKVTEVAGFAHSGFWKTTWGADSNEDEGHAVVRFNDGRWLELTITQLDSNPKRGMLEITGTRGSYILNGRDWEIIRHADGERIVTSGKNRDGQQHLYYRNLRDHLVKGKKLIIDGPWSRRPIHILDLARTSARQGKTLRATYG